MLKPLIELFSGVAFKPDAYNGDVPLNKRIAGDGPVLVASFNQDSIRFGLAQMDKDGVITVSSVETAAFDLLKIGETFPKQAISNLLSNNKQVLHAIIGVGGTWMGNLSESGFGGDNSERHKVIRDQPEELAGPLFVEGMRYALVSHPRTPANQSVIFSFPEPAISEITALIEDRFGLGVIRVQNGCFSMFEYVINRAPSESVNGRDILIVDYSGLGLLSEQNGTWTTFGFLSGINTKTNDEIATEVSSLLARRSSASKPLAWVSSISWDLSETIKQSLDGGDAIQLFDGTENLDLVTIASESSDEWIGIDLNPAPRPARPHIKPVFRLLTYGLTALSLLFAFLAFDGYRRNARINSDIASATASIAEVDARLKTSIGQRVVIADQRKRASSLAKWVSISMPMQPPTVLAFDSVTPEVVVQKFAITQTEGTGQLQIDLIVLGKTDQCYVVIDEMVRRLGNLGFILNTQSAPASSDGRIHFVGKFLYPSLDSITWPDRKENT